MQNVKNGVWVTMITPFLEDKRIDYENTERLIEWYIENKVSGIFAVCQSSEMFNMTFEERYELAKFVIEKVNGRVGVVISGHVEDSPEKQIAELKKMADLKPDALVLITNRLLNNGSLTDNLKRMEEALPKEIPLGLYECPYPYKRLLSEDEIKYLINSDRYVFLKDTCCDVNLMKKRIVIVRGSNFKLFNANSATLLETLKYGYHGYCGIMANIHPDLYVWLCENYTDGYANLVSSYLSVMSLIEEHGYPYCAKRYLKYENIPLRDVCRKEIKGNLTALDSELESIYNLTEKVREELKNERI